MRPVKLGVLISGRGSNLGAILDAIAKKELDAEVALVVSNKRDALGLERARAAGVATTTLDHKAFATREAFDARMVEALRAAGCEWIVLAGFMRIVTRTFLDAFPMRVLNIHPSLLPAFPGVDAQAQAIAYGARISGCTVHFVDAGTDTGPILAQAAVPVLEGDTRDDLAARILVKEHELLVLALSWIGGGLVEIVAKDGARPIVRVRGATTALGIA